MDLQQQFDQIHDFKSASKLARRAVMKSPGTMVHWFYDKLGMYYLEGSRKSEGIERVYVVSVFDSTRSRFTSDNLGADWMDLDFVLWEST